MHCNLIIDTCLDAYIKKNRRKKKTDWAEPFDYIMLSSLQVGKTPKPEMKRILEEINAIKTKVAMLSFSL